MTTVISVENLSKSYRLGQITGRTLTQDLNRWWARLREQPDPYLKIGQADRSQRAGELIWALKDVSFTVQQGEVLGIIGRNGAGKSTLLKILSRVTAPTSGVVKVQGRIASLLEVGTGFHPELTGRENVYLNGAILGMSKVEVARKFDEIVDFAEIQQFIDTPVKRYSSGMYVRLAFAVAAHLEPEILVVDEVLAVGDVAFQQKCLGKMGEVAQGGRTVLFVSHNMNAIASLCRRALLISAGKIRADGLTPPVISQYLSESDVSGAEYRLPAESDFSSTRIVRASLLDRDGHPLQSCFSGDSITIVVEFRGNQPIANPNLGIRINNELGITTFGVNNYMQCKEELCKNSRHGLIRVAFPDLPLNQGVYHVTLALEERGGKIERLENVLKFTVNPSNPYGTGKSPTIHQSLIIAKGIWHFEDLEDEG
ncbi:MAG: ABC transporter ATP-binding protein [Anaerolineales bacterium]|jgi:lipopolysaccharide transport system ATP-binding protein|nr:ABC transporter ATP-binding protein [Anaerolineales bacterium]